MNKECPVTQDLLPLYEEDLLQPGTKQFVEEHLKSCQECRQIAEQSQIPLPVAVEHGGGSKKMMRKITLKLTTIQIFFVAIAFILAMGTTVMNNNSGFIFILTYALLGAVTYLFYRSILIAVLLAGIPNFVWNCLLYMTDWFGEFYGGNFWEAFSIALTSVIIHLIITFIGIVIGFCILKIREEN